MTTGKAFWRTLDELADDPSFRERLYNEFPSEVEAISDPTTRRTFLKLMGASLALAGVTACTRQPEEKIVPYVRQPEELVLGKPLFFATAMSLGGVATGLLVESHEGRPTKIEGNPLHPGSLGAADVFNQSAALSLYDPDRAKTITNLGEIRPWAEFLAMMRATLISQKPLQGVGIRILTEAVNSPTLAAQIQDVLSRFPSAKWHQWDPTSRQHTMLGARQAFGEFVEAQYKFENADVILSLDGDFLGLAAGALRYAREFAERRRPDDAAHMNRLYALETMPSFTGAKADHRLPLKPSEIEVVARQIAAALGVGSASAPSGDAQKFVAAAAKDLGEHRGRSLVVAGESQPPAVHALAHAMNQALGNVGATVIYTEPVEIAPVDQVASIRELTADMDAGRVDLLVIIGGNPVFTAPADVPFAQALAKVQNRVRLGLYEDETSAFCQWQIPQVHFLEEWSDARAFDGTVSIVQPLIAPLYGGRSAHEVLAAMSDRQEQTPHDLVREHWAAKEKQAATSPDFEARWRRWLHDGLMADSAFTPRTVSLAATATAASPVEAAAGGYEISYRLDPSILDGRFANNGWLQETPKPITKLTWDNAVILSPATAEKLRVDQRPAMRGGEHGEILTRLIELKLGNRTVRGPVFAIPGHPDDCVTVHLGYGRQRGGHIADGAGFNAFALRASNGMAYGRGLQMTETGEGYSLACTQYHHLLEGRGIVRAISRDEFVRDPKAMHEGFEAPPRTLTLYPEYKYDGYKWGMAIDVNACTGCNACIVGCVAENNIAVIGKDQVLRGREMHWLRLDTYFAGHETNPETYFQPMPCMQCENAPCEVVCPVGATVHSHEGLNDMVYNRCVGTRYCSNNCPYKVRRFNYLLYQDFTTPSTMLGRNPDVTVRSRGVMEKCTYCVQRINRAKIDSEKQSRRIEDGEIKTACQQTCPTDAIIFGDLNDPNSRVARLQKEERNYAVLAELNTRPRTTYLGVVRNVNPELGE
ncbi:MAG: TAT-variant-translocated molybdopterin oxidoreductase [Acidobacteriaceae bacterium]|jgi:molybdopterin-containing oxidoreductase family iron-sulfur binding subunit|nr:TAT-variant-translocated molybdopterin oxidoreductase [Acidobacteriaceae bacterium]